MIDIIERRAHLSELFDVYGVLLTDKQRQMFDLYYQDDFSLGEIAEECQVSRQAVFDIIKRTEHALADYEQKLRLVERNKRRQIILGKLGQAAGQITEQPQREAVQALILALTQEDDGD